MRIDVRRFEEGLMEMEEKAPWGGEEDFKLLLAVISGNKTCMRKITLGKIKYLIDNLDSIMEMQAAQDPKVDLRAVERSPHWTRRAI